jgi:hypothetical protein
MSTRTKRVEVWALADQYGFLLAHGNPNAERQDGGEPPCPPYHVVSFLYESDFFWNHIVWARRKWELDETGACRVWNRWIRRCYDSEDGKVYLVRPVKLRVTVEIEEKGAKA